MRKLLLAALLSAIAAATAIAQPAPPPDKARIYFYRLPAGSSTPIWTVVYLNGASVGDSSPGTYFWRDVPPGTYEITLRSQGKYPGQFQTATARAGETLYVRIASIDYFDFAGGGLNLGGGNVAPGGVSSTPTFADQIVAPEQARREMARLSAAP